jgi:hypothetical protein
VFFKPDKGLFIMAAPLATQMKARLLKAVIDQVTGGESILEDRVTSIKIILTEDQIKWIQDFIDKQLEMKTRPDIEIDVLGIIAPVILKRIWPVLALLGGGAAVLFVGALSGKGKKR